MPTNNDVMDVLFKFAKKANLTSVPRGPLDMEFEPTLVERLCSGKPLTVAEVTGMAEPMKRVFASLFMHHFALLSIIWIQKNELDWPTDILDGCAESTLGSRLTVYLGSQWPGSQHMPH